MNTFSLWYLEDSLSIPAYETLPFPSANYFNWYTIYKVASSRNKSWPILCKTYSIKSSFKKCDLCVDNSSKVGNDCVCYNEYYEDIDTLLHQGCTHYDYIQKNRAFKWKFTTLVISNSCSIYGSSYYTQEGGNIYHKKTDT